MATILAVATHASDDPTKASLAFITAAGAVDAKAEAIIALVGEAAYLAKEAVRDAITGVGFPPLRDVVGKVLEAGVPIYV